MRIDGFAELWRHDVITTDGEIKQVVKNLPAGTYRLEADMIAANKANQEADNVFLFAQTSDGEFKLNVSTEYDKPQHFVLEFTTTNMGDATIGMRAIGWGTANWAAMDNVKLTCVESKLGDMLRAGIPALQEKVQEYTVDCSAGILKSRVGLGAEFIETPTTELAVVNSPARVDAHYETQAFIVLDRPLDAGDRVYVSFDYKSSEDADIFTSADTTPGGDFLYDYPMGNLHSTTEWQTYNNEIIAAKSGVGCFVLNLSNYGKDVEFQFKNIKVSRVKRESTPEDLADLHAAMKSYYNTYQADYTLVDGTVLDHETRFYTNKFTYTRKFGTTGWQSLYVPAPLPVSSLSEQGLRAAYINAFHQYDTDGDDVPDQLTMEIFYVNKGTLYPNHPYLGRATTTGDKTIVAENVTVEPAEEGSVDCSSTTYKYTVTGRYQKTTAAEIKSNGYYIMSGGSLSTLSASSNANLGAERWFLNIENRGAQYMDVPLPKTIKIRAIDEDGTIEETAITDIELGGNADGEMYDLIGRRVQNAGKGVYIQNGKKVMVK